MAINLTLAKKGLLWLNLLAPEPTGENDHLG